MTAERGAPSSRSESATKRRSTPNALCGSSRGSEIEKNVASASLRRRRRRNLLDRPRSIPEGVEPAMSKDSHTRRQTLCGMVANYYIAARSWIICVADAPPAKHRKFSADRKAGFKGPFGSYDTQPLEAGLRKWTHHHPRRRTSEEETSDQNSPWSSTSSRSSAQSPPPSSGHFPRRAAGEAGRRRGRPRSRR